MDQNDAFFYTQRGLVLPRDLEPTSVSYPDGEPGSLADLPLPLFLGWVGGPGEFLSKVVISPLDTGIIVDDFRAYDVARGPRATVMPLPSALPLFGTGLGILGFLGWRRRRKAQAV